MKEKNENDDEKIQMLRRITRGETLLRVINFMRTRISDLKVDLEIAGVYEFHSQKRKKLWNNLQADYFTGFHGLRTLCFWETRLRSSKNTIESITKNGFDESYCSKIANKGRGIYLSSHINYQLLWGGCSHIIICDAKTIDMNTHHAEISTGYEYLMKNSLSVLPRYLVDVTSKRIIENNAPDNPEHQCHMCPNAGFNLHCQCHATFSNPGRID